MRQHEKANQSSAAIHNRWLAVHLLRIHGSLSRRQLAQITGLRTSTLTYIVRDLMQQNMIRTIGKAKSKTVGKKQILLEINPDYGWVVGVSLEHALATLVYLDAAGNRLGRSDLPFTGDLSDMPERLEEAIHHWAATHKLRIQSLLAAGVGLPGLVDAERGEVVASPVISGQCVAMSDLFSQGLNVPVVVDNDANLAALAEVRLGKAGGLSEFVYVGLHQTGDGDAVAIQGDRAVICLQGEVYRGAHHVAGGTGCIFDDEPVVVLDSAQLAALADPDAPATAAVLALADWLGPILSQLAGLIDPQAIILGGGVRVGNRAILQAIRSQINQRLAKHTAAKVDLMPSGIVDDQAAVGAAVAAIDAALRGDAFAGEYTEPVAVTA